MFKVLYAQLRLAISIVFARSFHLPSLHRLIEAVLATRHEFSLLTTVTGKLLNAPVLGEEARRAFQLRRFRTQAIRAAQETAYYDALFKGINLNPGRLTWREIQSLPLTTKATLQDQPDAFIRRTQNLTLDLTSISTT